MVESEKGGIIRLVLVTNINDIHKIIWVYAVVERNDGRNPGPDKGITSTKCQFIEFGYIR